MFPIFYADELQHLIHIASLLAFLWLLLGLAVEASAARHMPVRETVTAGPISYWN